MCLFVLIWVVICLVLSRFVSICLVCADMFGLLWTVWRFWFVLILGCVPHEFSFSVFLERRTGNWWCLVNYEFRLPRGFISKAFSVWCASGVRVVYDLDVHRDCVWRSYPVDDFLKLQHSHWVNKNAWGKTVVLRLSFFSWSDLQQKNRTKAVRNFLFNFQNVILEILRSDGESELPLRVFLLSLLWFSFVDIYVTFSLAITSRACRRWWSVGRGCEGYRWCECWPRRGWDWWCDWDQLVWLGPVGDRSGEPVVWLGSESPRLSNTLIVIVWGFNDNWIKLNRGQKQI
jgi:hypothetical protein